jgi:hypothetical protein
MLLLLDQLIHYLAGRYADRWLDQSMKDVLPGILSPLLVLVLPDTEDVLRMNKVNHEPICLDGTTDTNVTGPDVLSYSDHSFSISLRVSWNAQPSIITRY